MIKVAILQEIRPRQGVHLPTVIAAWIASRRLSVWSARTSNT
jgi:hypothetical protein